MPRIAFITEFDGTDFAGFQSQENARAVQDVIEKALEELLISAKDSSMESVVKEKLVHFAKEFRKYQTAFNQEFLIGKEDKEFHLTYAAILSLCENGIKEKSERLILQSEVENLMAITKEALEKEWPEFREMAYFYLTHGDKELLELPNAEKVLFVRTLYKDEFYNPMKQIVENALGTQRAQQIMEVEIWI